jgi:hypothetical protein
MSIKAWTVFGDDMNQIEDRVQDYIDRGGKIISVGIGYGPPPSKVAGRPHAPEGAWHGLVVLDTVTLRDSVALGEKQETGE